MTVHQHVWLTQSSHPTSEGIVSYQACACGRLRILTSGAAASVEVAASS